MRNRVAKLSLFALASIASLMTSVGLQAQQPGASQSPGTSAGALCRTPVKVIGAVRAPSSLELRRRVHLIEALAIVGGLTEGAQKIVQVFHSAQDSACSKLATGKPNGVAPYGYELFNVAELKSGGEQAAPYVLPGDTVFVSESPSVYVVGSVRSPEGLFFRERLTVKQAVAMTGGALPEARADMIHIYRRTPGSTNPTDIPVDLKAIMERRAEDILLQPYDIVDVPGRKASVWPPLVLDQISVQYQLPLRIVY